jgi:epsilon-lactone hydrolase
MSEASLSIDAEGNLLFGTRTIPVPRSISPQARELLIAAYQRPGLDYFPALTDKDGWKALIAAANASFEPVADMILQMSPAGVETTTIADVTVHVGTPQAPMSEAGAGRALLVLHGGALIMLEGRFAMAMAAANAAQAGCKAYSVDYRMPPDFPYPAALDDGLAVYRELLHHYESENIMITGGSAGGNLAAALTLKIRDLGLPMPAGVILLTPEIDLTESGDTFETNRELDAVLKRGLPQVNLLYADGHDLADPYLSPLFGDFSRGFPPTFIQAGTRDVFLSNAVRMHRALRNAGIAAELHVWEAMPHGGFGGAPEDMEMMLETVCFMNKYWGVKSSS